jgi:hypothetical protein
LDLEGRLSLMKRQAKTAMDQASKSYGLMKQVSILEDKVSGLVAQVIVVGMTYGAHHGPGNMPAGVPGVRTASARENRLRSKGRLRQQPAGDSAEESWNRAMKTKPLNGCLAKSRMAPIGAAGAQDRSDERHDHVQLMSNR